MRGSSQFYRSTNTRLPWSQKLNLSHKTTARSRSNDRLNTPLKQPITKKKQLDFTRSKDTISRTEEEVLYLLG